MLRSQTCVAVPGVLVLFWRRILPCSAQWPGTPHPTLSSPASSVLPRNKQGQHQLHPSWQQQLMLPLLYLPLYLIWLFSLVMVCMCRLDLHPNIIFFMSLTLLSWLPLKVNVELEMWCRSSEHMCSLVDEPSSVPSLSASPHVRPLRAAVAAAGAGG